MKPTSTSEFEKLRLQDLWSYKILDTESEKDFDDLTKLAAHICGTQISLISLVDENRQWFKSHHGLASRETDRQHSFCSRAIEKPDETFVVEDATTDERFSDNPLVTGDPNIKFYAGIPLISDNGHALGTLCVIDNKPKVLKPNELDALKTLSSHVMYMLELRKTNFRLTQINAILKSKNIEIEEFASVAAHDLKLPLTTIKGYIDVVTSNGNLNDTDELLLSKASRASVKLAGLIEDLLSVAQSSNLGKQKKTKINIHQHVKEIRDAIVPEHQCQVNITTPTDTILVNQQVFDHALNNLFTNAIKYCDKPKAVIDLEVSEDDTHYQFAVSDNGPGIDSSVQPLIFKPFYTGMAQDRYGNKGTGLGLANVKNILEKIGGQIWLSHSDDTGTTFTFKLRK